MVNAIFDGPIFSSQPQRNQASSTCANDQIKEVLYPQPTTPYVFDKAKNFQFHNASNTTPIQCFKNTIHLKVLPECKGQDAGK
ncbi:hypothetical protein M7I_7299 [Glarea lozoyensis 74030]|uniref:Uncharacterized protein n=1 Tax=Glarea lozoyensis (strain ATCC 74030 / MF5533) TaxID=1104152 RepID=H0EWX4_GLAL7|nr:hypothetical protein M7I_7299 [Glarea lozoyensis 74030]